MMDISISEANSNIIYAAFFDLGIWRSLDKGESWQSSNDVTYSGDWEGFGGNCATVLADPSRANVVWASLSGPQNGESPTYLLKSTDTGYKNSWTLVNSGLPDEEIMGLSIDKTSTTTNRTLYVTGQGDIYKSTNDGETWSMTLNCDGCRFTAVDQFDGNKVYAGGENGLWRSLDAGANWQDVSHVDMNASNGIHFWDGDYDGVFDVKTDPNNQNWVYATALGNNKGLYKSTDNGNNWSKILTDDFMRKVAIVPSNSAILYATSSSAFEAGGYDENSKGVLFSSDGGQNWSQQNQGMAYPFALAVAVDNEPNGTVFIGSPGTGFQKSDNVLGLSSNENQLAINLYPNPFTEKITVSYPNSSYDIKISNRLGQEIVNFSNLENSKTIELKTLKSGIYFVQIANHKKNYFKTVKIIKR
jgi:photosystem II stability/assembly factor-like uncharacterized protein